MIYLQGAGGADPSNIATSAHTGAIVVVQGNKQIIPSTMSKSCITVKPFFCNWAC